MRIFSTLFAGLLFGMGLILSGMANPAKVQNFLDLVGTWDPSLAFVMGGAIMVTMPGFWLVQKRKTPLFHDVFRTPPSFSDIILEDPRIAVLMLESDDLERGFSGS